MDDLLKESMEIYQRAMLDYQPYATVLMFSGGDDSLTALGVADLLKIRIDYLMHVVTGTGIAKTTEFVRNLAGNLDLPYIELSAGDKYEKYVLRKGFFGIGIQAHTFAYHLLKQQQFEHGASLIRQRKRKRNILFLNGARRQESNNRRKTMAEPIRADGANIWVNLINEWSKMDSMEFLSSEVIERNPVSELLHRSGECMCGTMQSMEERKEAAFWFPEWGQWLDDLEKRVTALPPEGEGFSWKWGERMPKHLLQSRDGQHYLPGFQPMCTGCTHQAELFNG
jgi:3'-phosphoadenosine 5'-phosphosulfate sulfotransferase (PAPS reductase)/FAD synthetase